MRRLARALFCLMVPVWPAAGNEVVFQVAPGGADHADGSREHPFATPARALAAVRAQRARPGGRAEAIAVELAGGTYYLAAPLRLGPDDGATQAAPLTFRSARGETAVISGGVPVTGWRRGDGPLWTADVPEAARIGGQQLIVGGQRQIRARHPNFDPAHPYTGGFLFARSPKGWTGSFGACVGSIHNGGDWLEYAVEVPADGTYGFWVYYGAANQPFGNDRMDGRTQVQIDGGSPTVLSNLPDTGDWGRFAWGGGAELKLSAGRHTLRWTNVKGGGLNLDAFALCDAAGWRPQGAPPTTPPGGHLLVLQCESFTQAHGAQMTVDGYVDQTGRQVYFDAGALKAWPHSPDKVLHAFIYEGGLCSNTMVPVATIDEATSCLMAARKVSDYRVEVGARFFVDNIREALDSPGEWYLDRAAGRLYWWPPSPELVQQPASLSNQTCLVELAGDARGGREVAQVRFEDLVFEATDYDPPKQDWYHSDSAAIWLREASGCRIARCRFRNLGGTAAVLVGGCHDNELLENEVAFGGAGGFTINGNPNNQHLGGIAPGRPAERNTIRGSTIHHTGLLFKHGNPVCVNSGERNRIAYNSIMEVPRMGILLTKDCGGNVIEHNEVSRCNLETGDSGAIYAYDVQKPPESNVIRGNRISDSIGMGTTREGAIVTPHYTWGIYLDGESSRFEVSENLVISTVRGGVFFNGGHDNHVENNILVDGSANQVEFSDYAGHAVGNTFQRNIVVWSAAKAVLGLGNQKEVARLNSDYNLFWPPGGALPGLVALQARGFEQHSRVADPRFVGPARGNYQLQPQSPALDLGFRPIWPGLPGFRTN